MGGQKVTSAKRYIKTHPMWSAGESSHQHQKAPIAKRCIKTYGSRGLSDGSLSAVRKHRAPKISHVIPRRTITDRRQKPRNINNQISNIERPDRELRATFSSNHARPSPEVTHRAAYRLGHRTLDGSGSEGSERQKVH